MKKNNLLLLLLFSVFAFVGCSDDVARDEKKPISSENMSIVTRAGGVFFGDYNYLSYEDGIVNKGYHSSIMYYPDEQELEELPVVVIMHGYMGQKEKLAFIGQELAKRGFASLVVTASNWKKIITNPRHWVYNYDVAFQSVKEENEREGSPLYHRLALDKISIVGHSMGAGGALYFGDQALPEHKIKSMVVMAPYSLAIRKPGRNTFVPTLVMAGGRDHLALPIMTRKIFRTLGAEEKKYFFDRKATHINFEYEIHKYPTLTYQIFRWLDKYGR